MLRDGGPFPGSRGFSSEIGHVRRLPGGAQCRCGQRGCIEAYLADYALYRDGRSVAELPHTDAQQPSAAQLVELVRRGGAGEQAVRALLVGAAVAWADPVLDVCVVRGTRQTVGGD